MKRVVGVILIALVVVAGAASAQGSKPLKRCAPDAVISGTVCMDMFEASVWRVPNALTDNRKLVSQIQRGTATQAALEAGGATHQGQTGANYLPCNDSGQNCANDIYAVSLPGVLPSAAMTWFQAQVACQNSLKRLPSNAEWQAAVLGTPDPGPDDGTTTCRTTGATPVHTGSRSACVSSVGAYDMVGNVYEWTADWVPRATGCGTWPTSVSPAPSDSQCLAGAATTLGPGVLVRGGSFSSGTSAGPLNIIALSGPSLVDASVGFRCAR